MITLIMHHVLRTWRKTQSMQLSACRRWFLAPAAGRSVDCCYNCSAPHRAATSHLQSQHQLYTTSDNSTTAPQHPGQGRYRDTSPHSAMFSRLATTSTTASETAPAVVCPPVLEIMSTSSIKYLRLTLTGYNLHKLGVLSHLCAHNMYPCLATAVYIMS